MPVSSPRSRVSLRAAAAVPMAAALILAAVSNVTAPSPAEAAPAPAAPAAAYNAAQDALVKGRYDDGLTALAAIAAGDANVVALQAFYSTASGDSAGAADALSRLADADPSLHARVTAALADVADAAVRPLDAEPVYEGASTAIVVLGFGLNADGGMQPELVERVRAGAAAAERSPESPVIVSGGNPRNGVAEGDAMRTWLIANGVAADRIHVENTANSTPQNAVRTMPVLDSLDVRGVVLATSPSHIRRATSDFLIAGANVIGAAWNGAAPSVPPLDAGSRLGLTVDATKVLGIPRTY